MESTSHRGGIKLGDVFLLLPFVFRRCSMTISDSNQNSGPHLLRSTCLIGWPLLSDLVPILFRKAIAAFRFAYVGLLFVVRLVLIFVVRLVFTEVDGFRLGILWLELATPSLTALVSKLESACGTLPEVPVFSFSTPMMCWYQHLLLIYRQFVDF